MLFKFVFIEIKFTLVLAAMLKSHDCAPLFTKGGGRSLGRRFSHFRVALLFKIHSPSAQHLCTVPLDRQRTTSVQRTSGPPNTEHQWTATLVATTVQVTQGTTPRQTGRKRLQVVTHTQLYDSAMQRFLPNDSPCHRFERVFVVSRRLRRSTWSSRCRPREAHRSQRSIHGIRALPSKW